MALIPCPDCRKMVSSRAAACINCGCPLEGVSVPSDPVVPAVESVPATESPVHAMVERKLSTVGVRRDVSSTRMIVAIVVPVAVAIIGFAVMNGFDGTYYNYNRVEFDPGDLKESWMGWFLVLVVITAFEIWWHRPKVNAASSISNNLLGQQQEIVIESALKLPPHADEYVYWIGIHPISKTHPVRKSCATCRHFWESSGWARLRHGFDGTCSKLERHTFENGNCVAVLKNKKL